jgi:hypothetical protein
MSIDAFQEGVKNIMCGKVFANIIQKRTAKGYPETPREDVQTEMGDENEGDIMWYMEIDSDPEENPGWGTGEFNL